MNRTKRVFYTELCYVLGIIILAFGAALTELSDLGVSMIIAPAYILHLKLVQILPWFTFGVAEYVVQGALILITTLVMRRFKLSYVFSFVTAIIYGAALDCAMLAVSILPADTLAIRIMWYSVGVLLSTFAISLFFHTYISPEAYELIVKEIARGFSLDINKVKMAYDCMSVLLSIVLSFIFFGFGTFRGIGVGTVIGALLNGFLISRMTVILEKFFVFKNRFDLEKYF